MEALRYRLSIQQTHAMIGIRTQPAEFDIQQPQGQLSIKNIQPELRVDARLGDLDIDSSAALCALSLGEHLKTMKSVYSQSYQVGLQQIAKMVEEGHILGDITSGRNAFADIAKKNFFSQGNRIEYLGPASNLNVQINYTPHDPQIDYTPGQADIQYMPSQVRIAYQRGQFDLHMAQRPIIDIRVVEYGLYN